MAEPRDVAIAMERADQQLTGADEGMIGYAAAQMFASGHVFNLRRWTVTTLEAPYTSLWHRDPAGVWTFYQDAPPQQACPRYFGARIAASHRTDVELKWNGPRDLTVRAGDVQWSMQMKATAATRLMNVLVRATPSGLFERPRFLNAIESTLPALGLGHVSLVGTAPNGQRFRVAGQDVWKVVDGSATVGDVDVGPPGSLGEQPRLGDYWVPLDMFAVSEAHFESLDVTHHSTSVGDVSTG